MAEKEKKRKLKLSSVWFEAKHIMWEHRKRLLIGLALLLVNRATSFVLPVSTKFLGDDVIAPMIHASEANGAIDKVAVMNTLYLIAGAVGVATIIQAITSFSLSQLLSVAGQRAILELRKDVQKHVTRLPTGYFDNTKTGVLISRIMNDAEGIRNLVGTGVTQLIGGILTVIVGLGVLFWLNWQLTFFILSAMLIFGGGMAYAFSKLRPIFRVRGEIQARVTGRLTESLGGIRVVKAYTAEEREDAIFGQGAQDLFKNIASSITGVSAVTAFATVIIGANAIIIMLMGGNALITQQVTFGSFLLYLAITGTVITPFVNMANIGTQISEAFAGLDRIREIRQVPTEGEQQASLERMEQLNGDIEFQDVWFEYEEGVPVLKGISFMAPAGKTTALVGSSGSGKSTLIGLVMAFHYPKTGCMFVDGRDIKNIRLRDYRSRLGVVLQDNFLFEGTITENIRYSKPDATEAEIREAGRIAHCDEFVSRFEKGYETIVGERGVKLSGGQRQRVAIARAILADPRILILDEATSSLDSESEALIQDGLNKLRTGRTTFVIAHRLSTIRSADQILVVEGGKIVERGTHSELIDLNGRYRELYDKQYKFEMNRFINPGEEIQSVDEVAAV